MGLRTIKDKSEECLECRICKNNCPKDVRDVYGADCVVHEISNKYHGLNAHFCLQHNMYHCWEHHEYCKKVYGASVMTWKAPKPKSIRDEQHQRVMDWDAEACRMVTWSDQIEFGIIKCAECQRTICECYPEDFREYEGGKKTRTDELRESLELQKKIFEEDAKEAPWKYNICNRCGHIWKKRWKDAKYFRCMMCDNRIENPKIKKEREREKNC